MGMERVYLNHRRGERYTHIELSEEEVQELLADLDRSSLPRRSATTEELLNLLEDIDQRFSTSRVEPEYGPCPAGLMSLGDEPLIPCVITGPHTMHRAASGHLWTDAAN